VLPRFLNAVAQRESPVLLDLGPAIGANVSFLGERLACRLLIGDVYHDLAAGRSGDELRESICGRLERTVTSALDGVLCWDWFDYLDRNTAKAVAEFVSSRLAPGGVVHGMFSTQPGDLTSYTRYIVQSPSSMTCRLEAAAPRQRAILSTRDLSAIFPGTKIMDSVLLKNQRREILIRKG